MTKTQRLILGFLLHVNNNRMIIDPGLVKHNLEWKQNDITEKYYSRRKNKIRRVPYSKRKRVRFHVTG